MDVERMHFARGIYHAPVLHGSDSGTQHGSRIHSKLLPIDIEAVLVFGEDDSEVGIVCLDGFQLLAGKLLGTRWAAQGGHIALRFCCLGTTHDISQHHRRVVISIRSSIDAPGAYGGARARSRTSNDGLHTSGRRNENVTHSARALIVVMV